MGSNPLQIATLRSDSPSSTSKINSMKRIVKNLAGLVVLFSFGSFLKVPSMITGQPDKKFQVITDTVQEPRITIVEMSTPEQIVIYVTDSAGSSAEIGQKFAKILPVELGGFLKKYDLRMAGPPCAWYQGTHFPFVFDVGAPVNKMPAATEGRIKVKQLPAGNAVVAHFYGPYDQVSKGYMLVGSWIKEHNKTVTGAPYEVYIGDPGIEKDPYKVLTNIIFPVK
jgi:effector-binding domain-containing protein